MNKRKVFCVKDKGTGKLLPKAGIWTDATDPEIEKFTKRVDDCDVVECELIEKQ